MPTVLLELITVRSQNRPVRGHAPSKGVGVGGRCGRTYLAPLIVILININEADAQTHVTLQLTERLTNTAELTRCTELNTQERGVARR